MRRQILIAISDSYQMNRVKEALESELIDISIDLVFDEQTAKEKIKSKAYALVVTHQHLPKDGKTPIQEEEKRGLGLSKWIAANANRIPTVLLTFQSDTEVIEAVSQLQNCDAVFIGLDRWEDSLIKKVPQGLAAQTVEEKKRLDVDIYIDLENNRAEADLKGVNFPRSVEREQLKIQGSAIIKLSMNAAKEVDRTDGEKWQKRLQKLGEALMRHIFQKNYEFNRKFERLIGEVGGLQNTRIRFIVGEKIHAVALEAIFGPHELQSREDYWMLHAPIYRTIRDCPGYEYPLFHEHDAEMNGRPINVLIIESPTEGLIQFEGFTKQLGKLENVVKECRNLKKYLRPFQTVGRVNIGEVKLISWKNKNRPMKELLRKALEQENQSWHVVHYAGHSYFDPLTQDGYVFFPGAGRTIDIIQVDQFSAWLREANTRFIFLSSCHSSELGFVFAMARKNIPAIVGFRWDVDDDMAVQYAEAFYRQLLEGEKQSLEYAFLKARKNIYADNPYNPIWAAPVLVIQVP